MKTNFLFLLLIGSILISCDEEAEISSIDPVSWEERAVEGKDLDSNYSGQSYLSVYSQIYDHSEKRTNNLTATISIRNIYSEDSLYIHKAEYFNSEGHSIRTYFDFPIYLAPLETVDIVIDELDLEGGTGANFLFDWSSKNEEQEPYFEAIMISTYGQQGISFRTTGLRVK